MCLLESYKTVYAVQYKFVIAVQRNDSNFMTCEASDIFFVTTEGGEVYVWDIRSRHCSGRFIDDGCIWGSSIAVAPGGRFVACGARSGVVNVYETAGLLSSTNRAPKPAKILLNLTTSSTAVKFNASSEVLAMASDEKVNSLRLVSS